MNKQELLDSWARTQEYEDKKGNRIEVKDFKQFIGLLRSSPRTDDYFESFAKFSLRTTKKTRKEIREQQKRIDEHTTHGLIKDTIKSVKIKCAKEFIKDLNKIANGIIIHNNNRDPIFVSDNETLIDRIDFLKEKY